MRLYRVLCMNQFFEERAKDPSWPAFSDIEVAWFAHSAIRSMMRWMSECDVIHCDVHPGSIGIITRSLVAELLSESWTPPSKIDDFKPWQVTFINYQWGRVRDFHPRDPDIPPTRMWLYASDRQILRSETQFSAVDDLESLAYTLLAVQYSGQLPWADEIDVAAALNPSFLRRDGV
ncbi:hypothetical protein LXA43DRAFT_310125 [Ganoderma leucocontextum]|nr:hypothetical protein LXA43DRAFT_310125 [Ganoderma leucocontextum]